MANKTPKPQVTVGKEKPKKASGLAPENKSIKLPIEAGTIKETEEDKASCKNISKRLSESTIKNTHQ